MFRDNTGPLIYLANTIDHSRDRFAWRQAAHRSPLFQFAVSGGPHVLFQCIAVNGSYSSYLVKLLGSVIALCTVR
jgi:hypothetical protein